MALGAMGLTPKEISFDMDGDGFHIDAMLKQVFPVLQYTGGYTLLRPHTNSRDLIVIEPPKVVVI